MTIDHLLPIDPLVCVECDPPKRLASVASASGHRRWMHPTPLEEGGEPCPPPPRPAGLSGQWDERLRVLDGNPGQWRRWPYSSRSPAFRAAHRVRGTLAAVRRSDDYRIEAHHVDNHWWVYGIRHTEELNHQ